MTHHHHVIRLAGIAIALGSGALACGRSATPPELLEARGEYARAEGSEAQQYNPAGLHEAKVALDKAERAHLEGEDRLARDAAYVAKRKAQLAEIEGRTLELQKLNDLASANAAAQARGELSRTKKQLQQTGAKLEATDQKLEAEKKAHAEADARARDALTKLAAASAAAIKEEPRGTVITLPGNVLFASGKSELLPGAQERLTQVAEALKDQEDKKILIEGHTDSRGSEMTNMELARRRAEAVSSLLITRGIPAERVTSVGVGPARPVADNATAEGRANNRRVEIVIQAIEPK
jgi:outer membrane protein OmpA-like peptidoglycan-associated protein